jgi:hypothetical protein
MPDGINAPVDPVKPPSSHSPLHRLASKTQLQQLPERHDSVLPAGQVRKRRLTQRKFGSHIDPKSQCVGNSPPVGLARALVQHGQQLCYAQAVRLRRQ